jgi:hypothetical protein
VVDVSNVGQVVRYYKNGYRTGVLVGIEKKLAVIRHPVLARKQRIPLSDVEVLPEKETK